MAQCIIQAEPVSGKRKLGQLLSAYSDFVSHLVTVAYGHMHERDQVAIIHLLSMAAYQPQEPELDAFAFWIQTQLECTSNGPLLSYHLLCLLKAISTFYEFQSIKLVSIINFYLLHERFEVAAAAQIFLSVLITQNNASIVKALQLENSAEYAIESLLNLIANSNNQHGESDAFSSCLDTLSLLQDAFPRVFELHINDICQSLSTLALKCPEILTKTLKSASEIVNDYSSLNTLSVEHWHAFFEECSTTCPENLELIALLFDVARGVNRSFDTESTALLFTALESPLSEYFNSMEYILYNPSERSIQSLCEVLESFLKYTASLYEEELVQHIANDVFEPFIFDNINELVKHSLVIDICLDGFTGLVSDRKHMLPHLVDLLASSSLLSILATTNTWNRSWRLHRLLLSILNAVFAQDASDATSSWSKVLSTSLEDTDTKHWLNIQGGLYDLDGNENDVLQLFIDLAFVALLCGDHAFVSYLLDSRSDFGQLSRTSSWKTKLLWALNRILTEDVVYALSYDYLVRASFLWASCCVDYQDPTAHANTWLLNAMAGRTWRIESFVPAAFIPLRNCSLFPNALVTWMIDHISEGMSVPLLTIVKDTRTSSNRSQWIQRCFLKVASGLPKFSTLLINAYANNAVSKPILAPLEALEEIHDLCVSSASNPDFGPHKATSMAKILSRSAFPLIIPKSWLQSNNHESNQPQLPLPSLIRHITIVRQILLAEVEEIALLGEARRNRPSAAIFAKYWKGLESLSLACQAWSQTAEAKSGVTHLWSMIDTSCLELLNIWTVILAFFRPPPDLVKKLLASPITPLLWRAFRFSAPSSRGEANQAIALVSRIKKKKLFESSLGAHVTGSSLPRPSQQLLDAILISVHQITSLGDVDVTLNGTSHIKRALLILKALDTDHPFGTIIMMNSLTDLMLQFAEIQKMKGAGAISNSDDESQLLFLTATSSILNQAQITASPVISEIAAVSIMRLACCSPPEFWLKLPQTLHILSLVISFPISKIYGPIFASCFIFAVVLACSRLPPSTVPKQIASLITSPRLIRTLLLSTGDRSTRINMATVYEMMRCGMWKTAMSRTGSASKSFVATLSSQLSLHIRNSLVEPSSHQAENKLWSVLSIGGVMLTEDMINPLALGNVSTRDELRSSALVLQQWLRV